MSTLLTSEPVFRVLALQPLSVGLEARTQINLTIQGTPCALSIRPLHATPSDQQVEGGSLIAIEFTRTLGDGDLLIVAREGLELIEDFLSAVSVVDGATFRPVQLLQVGRFISGTSKNCEFVQFLNLRSNHWERSVSEQTVKHVRNLLAHWDGLERGHRLRRAARQYRHAIGNFDDVAAFQDAYIGLEAMEPPLAAAFGLKPGTEEVQGTCKGCGTTFVRKKSTLVGVRAYIHGSADQTTVEPQKKGDWNLINKLRHDVVHSLVDDASVSSRAHDGLMATMHYLHDAICICSHASNLASPKFRLVRGPARYVIVGSFSTGSWGSLSEWSEVLPTSQVTWVPHKHYKLVPQINFHNPGLADLSVGIARLEPPFEAATMQSLRPSRYERD